MHAAHHSAAQSQHLRRTQTPLHRGPISGIGLAKTRQVPMPTHAPCNADDGKRVDAVSANISIRLVPLRVGGVSSVYTVALAVSASSGQYHASAHPFSHTLSYKTNGTLAGKSFVSQGRA